MKIIKLGFVDLEIHDKYVIGRTHEDERVSIEMHQQVIDTLAEHIDGKYAIILDEVNSYSVDMDVMMHMRNDSQLLCVAAVYYRLRTRVALEAAARLINKPVKFCDNMDEAVNWVEQQFLVSNV